MARHSQLTPVLFTWITTRGTLDSGFPPSGLQRAKRFILPPLSVSLFLSFFLFLSLFPESSWNAVGSSGFLGSQRDSSGSRPVSPFRTFLVGRLSGMRPGILWDSWGFAWISAIARIPGNLLTILVKFHTFFKILNEGFPQSPSPSGFFKKFRSWWQISWFSPPFDWRILKESRSRNPYKLS